ncbi:hypothetical protein J1614_008592 [Plenodomus biglobosus]|nr:hypothetical protein J1614_008592 [Plenodomus biglobosus]
MGQLGPAAKAVEERLQFSVFKGQGPRWCQTSLTAMVGRKASESTRLVVDKAREGQEAYER